MPRVFRPGTAALAFASALLPAAALAQVGGPVPPLPTYDVSAYCEMVGTSSGKSWNRHVCLKKEETAKADILPNWRMMIQQVRETCDHYAVRAGGSYYILGACLTHYAEMSKTKGEDATAAARLK
jgi:hypothetical protein